MDLGIGEIVKSVASSAPMASLGDAWQTVIGDRVAHWRLINAMELQVRTIDEARRLGLKIDNSRIPERYAFAWFEEATKQDEPELQLLFARLLARASAGDVDASDRRFITILGALTPIDAAIFQRIYSDKPFPNTGAYADTRSITEPPTMDPRKLGWPRNWAQALIEHFHPGQAVRAIEHLTLSGLIEAGFVVEGDRSAGVLPPPIANSDGRANWRKFVQAHAALRPYILPTELGRSLYAAVKE